MGGGTRVWLLATCLATAAGCDSTDAGSQAASVGSHIAAAQRPDDYDRLFPYYAEICATSEGGRKNEADIAPLGHAVIIDHGYGIRTQYGHNDALFVKTGDEIARGQKIATLGNSGRSTGPHLHYVVEVRGKTRDPLDYIFD